MQKEDSNFLKACRLESVNQIPVWFMRQAGRYDADYRAIRQKYTLVEICEHPEVCADVTRMPVQKLGVDAAILFSDIMIPIGAMGLPFEIRENVGPIIASPVRTREDVDRLTVFHPRTSLPHVLETIELLTSDLRVPLIGFTGAPFTLASYMIEGGPSREYARTKQMMYESPAVWGALMDKLAKMIVSYGQAQVQSGASALQLFDSWVGSLSPEDYATYVFPTMSYIFENLRSLKVPLIYFGVTTGELLSQFRSAGATVIGVDWRVPLPTARLRVGHDVALQGNLDPALLHAPWPVLENQIRRILDAGMEYPGYTFNLGHGVRPSVDVNVLRRVTEFVHEYSARHFQSSQVMSSSAKDGVIS
ncbi:uroporphyrinogen decarboxylase [Alicyclobacillus sp. SP_1]|uniref:uroporphyrinogen decarboxylase n=1 Tax=Alicyclobacillus sp. SP_1 TaxID=2942475 RepID=UPI00215714F9|nr:uroporphyrinogen decarboxylase [Alicyclobacillus sp. SP_1]